MNSTKKRNILLVCALLVNLFVYYGTRLFTHNGTHFYFTIPLDNQIPVIPWTLLIYGGAYLFWGINYYLCITYEESGYNRYFIAHLIGEAVCFLTFILLPTTFDRSEAMGTGLFDRLLKLLYSIDSPDNLLPSIHCFLSWLCWIGTRKNTHIPKWYQYTSLAIAIAICISTLTVKQHVIADLVTGVLLAELSYLAAGYCGRCLKSRETDREKSIQ